MKRMVCNIFTVGAAIAIAAGPLAAETKRGGWDGHNGNTPDYHDLRNPRFKFETPVSNNVAVKLKSYSVTGANGAILTGTVPVVITWLYPDMTFRAQVPIYPSAPISDVFLPAGAYYLVISMQSGYYNVDGEFTLETNRGTLNRCFVAFKELNYKGTSDMFCKPSDPTPVFRKNEYGSFRVPKYMYLKVWDKDDRTGNSRTYYTDIPYVGDNFNNDIGSAEWGEFMPWEQWTLDNGKYFIMNFLSDTQFTWTQCSTNDAGCATETSFRLAHGWDNKQLVKYYAANVRDYIQLATPDTPHIGGVTVNGDLTEYGDTTGDLGMYRDFYERGLNRNSYAGLGNHDYENNVGGCRLEQYQCTRGMIEYIYNHAKSVNPVAHDAPGTVKFAEYVVNGSPGMSLSYSWEIGNVHFVQLNNFLTYTNVVDGYNIRSAYSWLIKDLNDAKRRRKTIILNLHKPCSVLTTATVNGECGSSQVLGADGAIISDIYLISEFKNLLTNYPVSAIFTGHLHPRQGFRQFRLSNGTLVPLFISGSQDFGTLLKAWLSERNLAVYKVKIDHYLENVTPLQRATETYIGTWTLR